MPKARAGAGFVSKLVKDPANPPRVRHLIGFLGASSEKGKVRLYLSSDLSSFIDIPVPEILHQEQGASGQSRLGAVDVWVNAAVPLPVTLNLEGGLVRFPLGHPTWRPPTFGTTTPTMPTPPTFPPPTTWPTVPPTWPTRPTFPTLPSWPVTGPTPTMTTIPPTQGTDTPTVPTDTPTVPTTTPTGPTATTPLGPPRPGTMGWPYPW